MTTAGAPRTLPLDLLSSELRSSIPCTSKWPRESTSQVIPIEALPHLGADEFCVSTAVGHHASETEHDLGVRPYPSVGVQLVVPMISLWSPHVIAHLCLTRNDASEDLACRCQPWSATNITAHTLPGHLGELLVLTRYLHHPSSALGRRNSRAAARFCLSSRLGFGSAPLSSQLWQNRSK